MRSYVSKSAEGVPSVDLRAHKSTLRSVGHLTTKFVLSGLVLLAALEGRAQSTSETLFWRDAVKAGAIAGTSTGLKSLRRDTKIYHYFNLTSVWPEIQTPQGRNDYTRWYVGEVTKRFWDVGFHASAYINAGPGLYLAIDPFVSSTGFGGTAIELTIPAGSKYLSVVRSIPLMPDTIKAFKADGLLTDRQLRQVFIPADKVTDPGSAYQYGIPLMKKLGAPFGFYRETLQAMTAAEHETFRRFVMKVLADQNIQLIEFNWKSKLRGFCPSVSQSAFNYIGTPTGSSTRPEFVDSVPMISNLQLENLSAAELSTVDRVTRFRSAVQQVTALVDAGKPVPKTGTWGFSVDELKQVRNMTFGCVP